MTNSSNKNELTQQHDIIELFPTQQEYKVKITEEGNALSQEFKEGLNTLIRMYLIDALRDTDHELDIRVKDNGSMRVIIKEGPSVLNKTVTPKGESD